jgi:hypothetical protein
MLKRLPGIAAPLCALLLLACSHVWAQAPAAAPSPIPPRISAMFTTWDEYYFYAGFRVDDRNVISTNRTPNSEPQQDDDVEVFFNTNNAHVTVRTPNTYQMAVSAGNGAYFSVGDGTNIPKPELVYTYKYAAIPEGTLNNPGDVDVGYNVELAIPWAELGQSGPPADGTTWGFNVISRNRDSLTTPATSFYSLSPQVKTSGDVQDPSKWSQITFTLSGQASSEAVNAVICPHTTLGQYPSITGEVLSGKWPASSRLSFGTDAIESPAPTEAEEPNTKRSAFTTLPPTVVTQNPPTPNPITPIVPTPTPAAPTDAAPTSILLPGGGSIQIVPGGIKNPFPSTVPQQQVASNGGQFTNPLTPKLPLKAQIALEGNDDSNDVAPPLGTPVPPRLLMALYRLDYNGDGRKAAPQNVWNADGSSALLDQPINGSGPWFSGLRPLWHEQQLSDMRQAGIEVALVEIDPDNPLVDRELDALVEALKEMKFAGQDYPLLAEAPGETNAATVDARWQAHVPTEFRADVSAADIAAADTVFPGGVADGKITARSNGKAYTAAWEQALTGKTGDVVIHTWNDFTQGTEVAASRQYGEKYVDDSRLQSLAFNGRQQWHAKYLQESVPRTIQTQTLYQVPVRIENAGTLPWRAGEGYSLCARWYTADGHLADDSAPRIPIGQDVLPGQSVTLSVGITARNGYGGDLDPGDYILVIDMVQGQYRWFTFAGDNPLQIPVHVVAAGDPTLLPTATFLGTTMPTSGAAGETLRGEVAIRNDGPQPWPENLGKAGYTLSCKIEAVAPDGTLTQVGELKNVQPSPVSVLPGELVRPIPHLPLVDSHGHPLTPGEYRLHWLILDSHGDPIAGHDDESLEVTTSDPGASFVLSDIPRQMDAGQTTTAKLALQNLSGQTWSQNGPKVGYHWYYLDGTEAQWNGGILSPLTQEVLPDKIDGTIIAHVRAPDQPGRYGLAWDVQEPDGTWASLAPTSKGDDLLQTIITVTGKGSDVPVDLSGQVNASTGDFNGAGNGFPDASLPPDGTSEILENPLELANQLGTKLGQPLYPDGYYSSHADHSLPFLYPVTVSGGNAISCHGQVIGLPGGNYRTLHLLAASGGKAPVSATFNVGGIAKTVTIAPWTSAPAGITIGYRSPTEDTPQGLVSTPVMLGDYVLTLDPSQRISSLTLPNAPDVKIVAITLEK